MADWIAPELRPCTQEEQENNVQVIHNLTAREPYNWTEEGLAALCGNMQSESAINPNRWEGDTVNYERGFGLVQWTPATKYIDWAGSDWNSNWNKQIKRIQYEAENGLQWFENPDAPAVGYPLSPPMTLNELLHSKENPGLLAWYFILYYEHPADVNQPSRAEQAATWYTFITGHPPGPVPGTKTKGKAWLWCGNALRRYRMIRR